VTKQQQQADGEIHEDQLLNFPVNALTGAFGVSLAENADIDPEDIYEVLVGATADGTSISTLCDRSENSPSSTDILYHLRTKFDLDTVTTVGNTLLREYTLDVLPEQVEIVVDLHLRPYYGDEEETGGLYYSEAKDGTTAFHAYATLYARVRNKRYTLAVRRLTDGDTASSVLVEFLGLVDSFDFEVKALYINSNYYQAVDPVTAYTNQYESAAGVLYSRRGAVLVRTREFPALGPEDEPVVDALAVGLGREEARVLAYLLLCDGADPVSRLDVRIGTGLGRERTVEALSALEGRDLTTATSIESGSTGRPRKGWQAAAGLDALAGRVRRQHALKLVGRAREVAAEFGLETGSGGDDPEIPFDAADADPTRVVLNWTPNGFHAPVFLAAEREFYRDAGVDLSVRPTRGSVRALDRVASGRADVGVVGSAVLCGALEEGRPVVPAASLYQRAMPVLYTVRSVFGAEFDSVEQLRGRTVAMPANSETALLARLFLSQAGVLGDVTVVDASGEERADLLEGRAGVATGMAADPPALAADGYTVDSILVSEQFPVPGPAIVVHADALADPPAALGGFLTATMRGVVATEHDRETAAGAVAARSEHAVDAERRRLNVALEQFSDSEAVRAHGWGWQSADDWRRLRMALGQTGAHSGATGGP